MFVFFYPGKHTNKRQNKQHDDDMEPYEITRALKLRGITQKQIAQMLGVTQSAVSGAVNGKASIRVQQAIANALDLPLDDVFPPKSKQKITKNNMETEADA